MELENDRRVVIKDVFLSLFNSIQDSSSSSTYYAYLNSGIIITTTDPPPFEDLIRSLMRTNNNYNKSTL